MAIENHDIFTIEASFTKITPAYTSVTYHTSALKVMVKVHTDGTKAVLVPSIDVEGSTTPFIEFNFTVTREFSNFLQQIHSGKEAVNIKSNNGVDFVAYLEDNPDIKKTSGEVTVRFVVTLDRSK